MQTPAAMSCTWGEREREYEKQRMPRSEQAHVSVCVCVCVCVCVQCSERYVQRQGWLGLALAVHLQRPLAADGDRASVNRVQENIQVNAFHPLNAAKVLGNAKAVPTKCEINRWGERQASVSVG